MEMLEILVLGDLYELDLHRLSSLEARAVVLCGILNLQQAFRRGEQPAADLVIITGQDIRCLCLPCRRLFALSIEARKSIPDSAWSNLEPLSKG